MGVDERDVKWRTTDPLDRSVVFLESHERRRTRKHVAEVESLSSDDVKGLIERPSRIDASGSDSFAATRDVYYRYESAKALKYSRAVVDFSESEGVVVSWSRYPKPVSATETKYINPRNNL